MKPEEAQEEGKYFWQQCKNIQERRYRSATPKKDRNSLVALNQSKTLSKTQSAPFKLQPGYSYSQTVKHEDPDHTFRNVLLFLIFAGLIIFFIDLHKQLHHERHQYELKRRYCHTQYTQNQCESPFQAIREKCHQLEICFKTQPEMSIRTSQIVAKLIGRLVQAFLRESSTWGAIILLIILAVLLFFICMLSRSGRTYSVFVKKE